MTAFDRIDALSTTATDALAELAKLAAEGDRHARMALRLTLSSLKVVMQSTVTMGLD